jgi:hypothetical protein
MTEIVVDEMTDVADAITVTANQEGTKFFSCSIQKASTITLGLFYAVQRKK